MSTLSSIKIIISSIKIMGGELQSNNSKFQNIILLLFWEVGKYDNLDSFFQIVIKFWLLVLLNFLLSFFLFRISSVFELSVFLFFVVAVACCFISIIGEETPYHHRGRELSPSLFLCFDGVCDDMMTC